MEKQHRPCSLASFINLHKMDYCNGEDCEILGCVGCATRGWYDQYKASLEEEGRRSGQAQDVRQANLVERILSGIRELHKSIKNIDEAIERCNRMGVVHCPWYRTKRMAVERLYSLEERLRDIKEKIILDEMDKVIKSIDNIRI